MVKLRAGLTSVGLVTVLMGGGTGAQAASSVSVTVNGTQAQFEPGPIERAGRIFVPLRGIFERLGASVVYANGIINATGNNRSVSLKIGSTQATVNGAVQPIDTAPFVIGASTYVPLRFVSQALGANVNYDGTNHIVALTMGGAPAAPPAPVAQAPAATAAPASAVRLRAEIPGPNSTVSSTKPTISTEFTEKVDPNTVKVSLDGLDVTGPSTRSESGLVYAPQSPLQSVKHTVHVTGKDAGGLPFDRSWSFVSGTETPKNFVTLTAPTNGGEVTGSFAVKGTTLPNARVHITAGAIANVGGIFALGTGNYTADTTADGSGNFSQDVQINVVSGGAIGLTVTSTDPASKASAEQKARLRVK